MGGVDDTAAVPNPGSEEALEQGCLCPVIDNRYGRGFLYPDGRGGLAVAFYFTEGCPLHKSMTTDDA